MLLDEWSPGMGASLPVRNNIKWSFTPPRPDLLTKNMSIFFGEGEREKGSTFIACGFHASIWNDGCNLHL